MVDERFSDKPFVITIQCRLVKKLNPRWHIIIANITRKRYDPPRRAECQFLILFYKDLMPLASENLN